MLRKIFLTFNLKYKLNTSVYKSESRNTDKYDIEDIIKYLTANSAVIVQLLLILLSSNRPNSTFTNQGISVYHSTIIIILTGHTLHFY